VILRRRKDYVGRRRACVPQCGHVESSLSFEAEQTIYGDFLEGLARIDCVNNLSVGDLYSALAFRDAYEQRKLFL
jgi:hypothetical protein